MHIDCEWPGKAWDDWLVSSSLWIKSENFRPGGEDNTWRITCMSCTYRADKVVFSVHTIHPMKCAAWIYFCSFQPNHHFKKNQKCSFSSHCSWSHISEQSTQLNSCWMISQRKWLQSLVRLLLEWNLIHAKASSWWLKCENDMRRAQAFSSSVSCTFSISNRHFSLTARLSLVHTVKALLSPLSLFRAPCSIKPPPS